MKSFSEFKKDFHEFTSANGMRGEILQTDNPCFHVIKINGVYVGSVGEDTAHDYSNCLNQLNDYALNVMGGENK